ncbi:MAG: response regulator [Anaerolineae bacterium]|nr:response regulator [Anaerolineae bacterium]
MTEKMPLRILLLEDNPDDSELVIQALRETGFEPDWTRVFTKESYIEQLDASLDLILADHSLPQFTGIEALKILQEQDLDVPFITISGSLGEEAAVEYVKLGAVDYLLKDRLARLDRVIYQALETRKLQKEQKRSQLELGRRLQESEAMAAISRALSETLDVEQVLQLIVESALSILPTVERAVIHLFDDQKQVLQVAAISGLDELSRPDMIMRPGEGVAGMVVETGKSFMSKIPKKIPDLFAAVNR